MTRIKSIRTTSDQCTSIYPWSHNVATEFSNPDGRIGRSGRNRTWLLALNKCTHISCEQSDCAVRHIMVKQSVQSTLHYSIQVCQVYNMVFVQTPNHMTPQGIDYDRPRYFLRCALSLYHAKSLVISYNKFCHLPEVSLFPTLCSLSLYCAKTLVCSVVNLMISATSLSL